MNKEDKQFIKREIGTLASITAKGFERVEKRFEQVDKRFEQIDKRFEQVDKRFENIETRLDRIENLLLQDHTNRIERWEDKMRLLETAMGR